MNMADGKNRNCVNQSKRRRLIVVLVVLIVVTVIALTVGLVLHFRFNRNDNGNNKGDNGVAVTSKRKGVLVDCLPELRGDVKKLTGKESDCLQIGCIWLKLEDKGAPWCTFTHSSGYVMSGPANENSSSYWAELTRIPAPVRSYQKTVYNIVNVLIDWQTDNRVRVKLYPKNVPRWEVPSSILNIESTRTHVNKNLSQYNVLFTEKPWGVSITRKSTGAVIFNSSFPGMILSDQFLQLTTRLPSDNVYGFGEHLHESFKHDMNWRLWSMFTRDSGPNKIDSNNSYAHVTATRNNKQEEKTQYKRNVLTKVFTAILFSDWNLYGQHPVYMNIEEDGQSNMVLLKNSNAMEVLLQPSPDPAITFRTIGGILDFYIFLGNSPSDVVKQYIQAIGKPLFPPYWSLGFHLCRWGYRNITDMEQVIDRNRAAQIPYDGQWADIDTFLKAYVFTYDNVSWVNFPNLVQKLKSYNMHFVTIVDPGIGSNQSIITDIQKDFPAYNMLNSGYQADIFVKSENNATLVGEVWPGLTVYPDFTNDNVQSWWTQWIQYYRETVGVNVDALWIDMNEPSNFVKGSINGCKNNELNYPPYLPHLDGVEEKGELFVKTLCMDSQQILGRHYDVHSLYAHTMAVRTYRSLEEIFPGQRPWTMTRSSFIGTGHYATKWQGDNRAEWSNMHYSIISLMEFGLFGFPMNGADICGFWLEASYEMCVRWHQLGAFYPFARNHNGKGDDPVVFKHQDPASFGHEFVNLVKPVLMTRYRFLPYFYTQLYRAHVDGETIFKPLFFEFPQDKTTLSIDKQFMLGPAFLISPVLEDKAIEVKAYFPAGRWYDYTNGEEIHSIGEYVNIKTPLDKFNLHIRGGYIVPWQSPSVTTEDSRMNDFGILVALDTDNIASGEMYWDDGISQINNTNYNLIKFSVMKVGELTITTAVKSTLNIGGQLNFKTIELYGLSRLPTNFYINGVKLASSSINVLNKLIYLHDISNLPMAVNATITWSID